jgi:hypothetical protein
VGATKAEVDLAKLTGTNNERVDNESVVSSLVVCVAGAESVLGSRLPRL